jgi:hypothetical protein
MKVPIGLALILGSTDIVAPKTALPAIKPAMSFRPRAAISYR